MRDPVATDAANRRRIRTFVRLDLAAALAGLLTLTAVWVAFDTDWIWPLWLCTFASSALLVFALRSTDRGHLNTPVFLVVVSFWLMLILVTAMIPSLFGGFAVLMVWPVLFAVPYVRRRTLRQITISTAVVAVLALPLALRTNPSVVTADVPSWVLNVVFVAVGIAFVGLSLQQVWSYSGRLHDTLEGLRDANAALVESEQELEERVAVRTAELEQANADLLTSQEELAHARDQAVGSSRELVAVLDNLADGLVVIDAAGAVARVNPAFEDMVGVPSAALLGRPAGEALPWWTESDAAGAAATGDIELSGDRVGKLVISRITDANGLGHRGTVVLLSDVTVEREIDRMKTDFISTVSHELRTPLTSVLGFVKIIRKRLDERVFPSVIDPDPKVAKAIAQVQDNLDIIVTEGERLASLINDVLDIAKMEAGRIDWREEDVDVNAVVEQAVAATTSLFEARAIPLNVELTSDLAPIVGDHHRLVQVVINLLSNAVKFTEEGSVTVRTAQDGSEIVVSVSDTGPGIAPEDHPKLFERFKQVGDTLTSKPQGTGLGLPISKEIVDHHGGRFIVDSDVGAGATFSFTLPARPDRSVVSRSPLDATTLLNDLRSGIRRPDVDGRATILVVDDHEPIRQLLRQELEHAGYRVLEAANGQEAVRLAREQAPDAITLDVMMPGLDGFDVAAVLRSDPRSMRIPIIVVSIMDDGERGRQVGVDRYLLKPVDTAQLLDEVHALLAQRDSHRRVVVVDEDAGLLETFRSTLDQQGWSVTTISDRSRAVTLALEASPDLVIANAELSSRISLVEALRAERETEHVVVVLFE